jgi:hypothetical protein
VTATLEKARLLVAIWMRYARVKLLLRRHPLAEVVRTLAGGAGSWSHRDIDGLSRAVNRGLLGPGGTIRCLPRALVLFTLAREHGIEADIVIGVQPSTTSHEAHAWVEVGGRDVGPKPGRMGRSELIRYP